MDIAATETVEERIDLLVILGSGVLAASKPGPQARSKLLAWVRAHPCEIVARPTLYVFAGLEATMRIKA